MSSSERAWSSTAPTYSSNIARTSAVSAAKLIKKVNELRSIETDAHVLDNGAGTGAVALHVASHYPAAKVVATDISASMLDNVRQAGFGNVETRIADTRTLSRELGNNIYTHVFNTFMLQTITNPFTALQEMAAVMQPGGVVGVGIWGKRNGPFEIWERACQSIDPDYRHAEPFDDPHAWRTVEELEKQLKEAGLKDVDAEECTAPFPFDGAEAFADFWYGAKNPAAVKCMSNWRGDPLEVRPAVERIVREQYADGRDILTWAVLGVGRK